MKKFFLNKKIYNLYKRYTISIGDKKEENNMSYANKKPGDAYPDIKENNNTNKNIFFKYWYKNRNVIFFSICGEYYQKMMVFI